MSSVSLLFEFAVQDHDDLTRWFLFFMDDCNPSDYLMFEVVNEKLRTEKADSYEVYEVIDFLTYTTKCTVTSRIVALPKAVASIVTSIESTPYVH